MRWRAAFLTGTIVTLVAAVSTWRHLGGIRVP